MPCSKSNPHLTDKQDNTESKQRQCANIRYQEEKKGQKMTTPVASVQGLRERQADTTTQGWKEGVL